MKSALLTSARSSSRLFPLHATEGEWLRPQRPQGFCSTLHVTVPDRPAAAKAVLRNEALHILLGPPGTVFHVPLALFPALAVLSTPKDPPLRNKPHHHAQASRTALPSLLSLPLAHTWSKGRDSQDRGMRASPPVHTGRKQGAEGSQEPKS